MFQLKQVAAAVGGRLSHSLKGERATGISTDTRTLHPGDLFIALRGPSFDGHAFVSVALRKGACAAIVDRDSPAEGPLIRVEDAGKAYLMLAAAWRMTLKASVVGITGSNGKTTVKEMVAHVLGPDRHVVKSPASYNNSIGVPHVLFLASPETDCVVLEMGTNHPGEMAQLVEVARPSTAVITCVGSSHLEGFGSIEGVADEKVTLLNGMRAGGVAIVNDDPRILSRIQLPPERVVAFGMEKGADYYPTDVKTLPDGGQQFSVQGIPFQLGLLGRWNVLNSLATCAVARTQGVSLRECARRLATFKTPGMRMERLELGGIVILNDAYNSNPDSASGAIRELSAMKTKGRKIAVIGDMLELGSASAECHRRLGRLLAESSVDLVVTVGEQSGAIVKELGPQRQTAAFRTVEEMRPRLGDLVRRGDMVLLKGSRGMGLERLVTWVRERVA